MAITVDGYAQAAGGGNLTTGSVAGLSTTNANDIIVFAVMSSSQGHGAGPTLISGTPSSTNTTGWTKRIAATSTAHNGSVLEVWYAKAAAPLTNETISWTWAQQLDDAAAIAIGFSGVDQTTPFDVNGSLPATNKNDSTTTAPSVPGVSTTAQNTMLLAFAGVAQNGVFTSPASIPSGFTTMGTAPTTNNGNLGANMIGAYQTESSPQAGLTITFATSSNTWIAVVDALRSAVQAVVTKSTAALIGF